jgi:acetoin utilization deacetylase AcuC-like enzyme
VPPGVLLTNPASLLHDTGPHPERAARLVAVERALEARDWLGWERVVSERVPGEALAAVHPPDYVERVERFCRAGGGAWDPDTIACAATVEAALHSAGGAVGMVDALLGGGPRVGASLHRPPGHHAESAQAMGFCFFNNVALAARRAIDGGFGVSRVMVLDWDVHHGNGTNDIFHATDEVLFMSVHESPLYPGTGPASDVGSGAGEGFTVNVPVPGGSGDEAWCSIVEHVAVPLARAFAPGLLLVSAGYDAHADDPLATCRVTDDGFGAMAASMRRVADELGVPLGFVLEGGYDVDALARSVVRTLEVAGADDVPPPDPSLELHPLAESATARLSDRWPALAPT